MKIWDDMKKIMFNDRYGLTQAVLVGHKTMTRRNELIQPRHVDTPNIKCDEKGREELMIAMARYHVGEIVAVAQSYKDAGYECIPYRDTDEYLWLRRDGKVVNGVSITPVCETNKMFTRADLMPHLIQITGIRIERLQDISDEDCVREGIRYVQDLDLYYFERMDRDEGFYFDTPREAFAALIDRVSGRGTWDRNPYVVVYEFELVKKRYSRKTS